MNKTEIGVVLFLATLSISVSIFLGLKFFRPGVPNEDVGEKTFPKSIETDSVTTSTSSGHLGTLMTSQKISDTKITISETFMKELKQMSFDEFTTLKDSIKRTVSTL